MILILECIIGCLVFGTFIVLSVFYVKSAVAPSVSIIGGADGPTAIFLAGKIGVPTYGAIIVGIAVFVITYACITEKKQDK